MEGVVCGDCFVDGDTGGVVGEEGSAEGYFCMRGCVTVGAGGVLEADRHGECRDNFEIRYIPICGIRKH